MRVFGVDVDNFLGFRSLDLIFDRSLQLVAGPNNAGKSSLIRLLDAFFSDPDGESLATLQPLNEYYGQMGPATLSVIKVWFCDLTDDEKELYAPLVLKDGTFWIALRCTRGGGRVTYRASKDATATEAEAYYRQVIDGFSFVKIPSVRVSVTSEVGGHESMQRLLDTLEAILIRNSGRTTSVQREFTDAIAPTEALVQDVLNKSAAAIAADLPFHDTSVSFKLPSHRHALRGMLESTVLESSGSDATIPVADRGTGFQSALVLGILRYVASRESGNAGNLMFAIEEPEAFLHPQTQRAMAKVLQDLSNDAQLLITTHSSVVVDSFDVGRILRLPLNPAGTVFRWRAPELSSRDAGMLTRYCSAANSELIFANSVIFVEGIGDEAVIQKLLAHICGSSGGHYARGITVIRAEGLANIRHLVHLAEHFNIRSYVLSDRDGLHSKGGARILLDVLKARASAMSTATREHVCREADKPSSSLRSAIANQSALNTLLEPFDAFVMVSDLEGLLLDTLGVPGVVAAIGHESGEENGIDQAFQNRLEGMKSAEAYEITAAWLGSKGWNSDRSNKNSKMKPHLAPPLIEAALEKNLHRRSPLRSLYDWLQKVVESSTATTL